MAGISITWLSLYFADEPKSLERGENHYKSDHVESLSYYPGTLKGKVHASMKEKTYEVTVSLSRQRGFSS